MNGLESYKLGPKNNWRRQVWNMAQAAFKVPREILGIYLPGHEDLDFDVATSKGFHRLNLIAVDRDETVIKTLRNRGRLVVDGELIDVLKAWPTHRTPLHLVHADLLGNISPSSVEIALEAIRCVAHSGGGIVIVNILRGREDSWIGRFCISLKAELGEATHRGIHLCLLLSMIEAGYDEWKDFCISSNRSTFGKAPVGGYPSDREWELIMDAARRGDPISQQLFRAGQYNRWLRSIRTDLEYKSKVGTRTQTFDSCIFKIPSLRIWRPRTPIPFPNLAAILAHRTMRLNG